MTQEEFTEQVTLAPGVELEYWRPAPRDPSVVIATNRAADLVGGHVGVLIYTIWRWFELAEYQRRQIPYLMEAETIRYNLRRELDRANGRLSVTGHF